MLFRYLAAAYLYPGGWFHSVNQILSSLLGLEQARIQSSPRRTWVYLICRIIRGHFYCFPRKSSIAYTPVI